MTQKVFGRPTFGGKALPIAVLVNADDVSNAQGQTRTRQDLTVGLALGRPGTATYYRESIIVAPFVLVEELLSKTTKAAIRADEVLEILRETLSGLDSLSAQLGVLDQDIAKEFFRYEHRVQRLNNGLWTWQQLWSATIIAWAIQHPKDPYWKGERSLWESIMRWLGIRIADTGNLNPFRETRAIAKEIERRLFSQRRTDLLQELGAWIRMDTDYKESMAQLSTVGELYEAYAKLWLTLIPMLATAGGTFWLKLAGEVIDGVIGVVTELETALRDEKITGEEEMGIGIAAVFSILPLGGILKDGWLKSFVKVGEGLLVVLMIGLVVVSIVRELLYSVGVIERRKAARGADIAEMEEYAMDQWIEIRYID